MRVDKGDSTVSLKAEQPPSLKAMAVEHGGPRQEFISIDREPTIYDLHAEYYTKK